MTGSTTHGVFEDPSDPTRVQVPNHLWRYAHDHSQLADAADELKRFLGDLAVEASIPVHTIESRAKTLRSYQEKADKKADDGTPKYPDPSSGIQDCVAARVILYTSRARDDFASVLESRTTVGARENPGDRKHNGYDSEHLTITAISGDDVSARHPALSKFLKAYNGLEIQLRSVAAHAWAEYEHDIRYKSGAYDSLQPRDKGQVDQWFVEAGGLRRFMDELFDRIQDVLQPQDGDDAPAVDPADLDNDDGSRTDDNDSHGELALSPAELQTLIKERFPGNDVGDGAAIKELIDHLAAMGVTTVGPIAASLKDIDSDQALSLMDYPRTPTGVRRLDDELLAAFGMRYVDSATTDDRKQLLDLRYRRVRGKFAIYSIHDGETAGRAVPAARAVRDLAKMVAERFGLTRACVDDIVALTSTELLPSARPTEVETTAGTLKIATNLNRSMAEDAIQSLINRSVGSGWSIIRAGDVLVEAPDAEVAEGEIDTNPETDTNGPVVEDDPTPAGPEDAP
ncbi:hypothetical protein [Rhodococcus jostii]|uniref:RelA/SpoT domain-containing protein n=1 Tax=Rhodococcus jostii TaxID=132919 RepID=A0ABU4CD87_RHOJO|nr:hypothetical protein [Rhodococcus jostii]MDV6281506.1 hypothetical protein [Rhodococcus jostii]